MKRTYQKRPDLKTVGRLIFGARPPRGQQMGDHYFGAIPEAVLHFLEDVEAEALNLGIPVKTRHNEVAPNQFEIAPLYEEANIAADHNQLLMDLLTRIARGHGMACLLHEKPFTFFNGSGKHINWSLMDSQGRNLFTPGDNKNSRLVFLSFLAGFISGMNRYHDLLQAVLASPGNELRLGGHEAPPAIISVFLGDELQGILDDPQAFISGKFRKSKMVRFEKFVPAILHDLSDRNRTSPVAFTGNKFEFRMPGASASLSFPIAVINLTVAAAHSGNDARIAVRIGNRLPLYVGASQRLLLSRAPPEVVAAVLAAPRARVASGTITGARELRRNLAELATRRSVAGHSEGIEGVGAVAACVDDATGATRAVLVSVYVQAGKTAARLRELREATEAAAHGLSQLLGGR